MAELNIVPECFIDTNLIETLVPTPKGYNHQKGCNNVAKVMQGKMKEQFALGIVDKDKRQVAYLDEFEEVTHSESLFLYKHKSKPHYMIQVSPATDGFILKCVAEVGAELSSYELPEDLKEFTSRTKQVVSKEDAVFKKLFQDIKQAKEMRLLKAWVKYLKENTFASEVVELENITQNIGF